MNISKAIFTDTVSHLILFDIHVANISNGKLNLERIDSLKRVYNPLLFFSNNILTWPLI